MNQTADIGAGLVANPPAELQELLNDPRTTDSAREAIADITKTPASASSANGHGQAHKDSSSRLGDGRLQVVDEKQDFTKDLSRYLDKWGMLDKGFAYDVVSVFGSQSTGKSTLLNRLFGTSFDVMDESKRQQTTKGIWMCPSAYSSTLVMDVEGTDGRERGEDQDFERKSALFSLASTEVLIVNLWEHQIGLYQGANMGLLKTVFEVNLGLFGGGGDGTKPKPQEKTLILFVIRDHVGSTPLSNLTATLTQDMERIWSSLSKPPHLSDVTLQQYFDLSFAALPHKVLMPEKFEESVLELRKRFTDRSRDDYVFQPAYHKRIPADGVGFYMEGIWQQVLTNKDLDLPTQQELLAQFRCDEIATAVMDTFLASVRIVKKPVEGGQVVEGLGAQFKEWLETALGKFDRDASRYHASIYQRQRDDLVSSLFGALEPLYSAQLKNLHNASIGAYGKAFVNGVKQAGFDFLKLVDEGRARERQRFVDGAKEVTIEGPNWEYASELALLDEGMEMTTEVFRGEETKKMINAIDRNSKRQLLEPVEVAMSQPTLDMWDQILTTYNDVLSQAESSYLAKAKTYSCTSDENDRNIATLRARLWLSMRRKLEEQTSEATVVNTLRTTFEDRFRYDEAGLPRVWKPEDDIEAAFKKAKEETLALLPLFANVEPSNPALVPTLPPLEAADPDPSADTSPFDPSTAFQLLTPTKLMSLESRFKRDADAAFVEAKRSMVSSVSQVPVWMYGALAVLGWNEAMAVLFNPLYFAMILILAASGYIVLQLGLAGPILQVSQTVFYEVKRIATEKLREAFAEVPEVQRHLARPVPASSLGEEPKRRDLMADKVLPEK